MAVKVVATLGREKYYTEVVAGENKIITDEPKRFGGQEKGFNPYEILASSLASCTAATLRMYIDKKGWDVDTIRVDVQFENVPQLERSEFKREICFPDANLDAEALEKLFDIAEACPVHKLLTNKIEINTEIVK